MSEQTTELDKARAAAFADEAGDSVLVEHNGARYEVRPATLAQERDAKRRATRAKRGPDGKVLKGPNGAVVTELDEHEHTLRLVIASTYLPGTSEHVFKEGDIEALMARPMGRNSLLPKLSKAWSEASRLNTEEEEGKS